MEYKRNVFESDLDYLFRLVEIKMEINPQDLDWSDIVELTGLGCHPDSLRKACQPKNYGSYAVYKAFKDNESNLSEEDIKKRYQTKLDIQKLRDENTSLNEKLRVISRKENIVELIKLSYSDLKPIEVPERQLNYNSNVIAIGGIADAHFGKDIVINSFNNEPLNVYNEEVFYSRMWNLLDAYVETINEEKLNKIYFFDLGDAIEGILRLSSLQVIKYGIVESTVKYAQFMATWLNELSKYVEVDYYGNLGNHSEIRPLGTKAGEFSKENMEIIITEFLKAYLVNNDRVSIKPNSQIQYVNIDGFRVLATHGQNESNLVSSVTSYKDIYDVKVDLMISGHLHNSKMETASLNTKVIQFPSIVGIDDYSMKLKKTAKAEGKLILKKGKKLINIDIELD